MEDSKNRINEVEWDISEKEIGTWKWLAFIFEFIIPAGITWTILTWLSQS